MSLETNPDLASASCPVSAEAVAELIGQVYETAPPTERGHMLEQLLRPLGVLSVFGVAHGIFANIRFKDGRPQLHVLPEDLFNICANEVIALANHVQQVSVETVDGLAQLLSGSPLMAGSAAAALLIATLLHRANSRVTSGTVQAAELRQSAPKGSSC
jgi:hypothetical protein